jgi:hypothetical protein
MWTLVVVVACVVAGLTGLASAIVVSHLAPVSSPPGPGAGHPLLQRIENLPSLVEPLQAGLGLDTAPDQTQPSVPRVSTATRHVRSPEEAALSGELHPATDRVMALLVGWVLLASLGGGLLAPRH